MYISPVCYIRAYSTQHVSHGKGISINYKRVITIPVYAHNSTPMLIVRGVLFPTPGVCITPMGTAPFPVGLISYKNSTI